jgi:signal recognition particle subunit SRP72
MPNFAVLVVAPGDEDAVRCKAVAHIKSDTMDKELTAIRATERLPINLSYYKVTHVDPSTIGSVLDLSMFACCCDCVGQ